MDLLKERSVGEQTTDHRTWHILFDEVYNYLGKLLSVTKRLLLYDYYHEFRFHPVPGTRQLVFVFVFVFVCIQRIFKLDIPSITTWSITTSALIYYETKQNISLYNSCFHVIFFLNPGPPWFLLLVIRATRVHFLIIPK